MHSLLSFELPLCFSYQPFLTEMKEGILLSNLLDFINPSYCYLFVLDTVITCGSA